MGEAGYLALTPADTAVMLLDCARMAEVWTLERAQRLGKKTLLELAAQKPGLWAPLPAQWHARDMEYQPGFTACLHYTALNQQPWHRPRTSIPTTRIRWASCGWTSSARPTPPATISSAPPRRAPRLPARWPVWQRRRAGGCQPMSLRWPVARPAWRRWDRSTRGRSTGSK